MRWEDERYVRLYTRDTMTWKMLSWQSKCLLPIIMRKLDRAGVLDLGTDGLPGLAVLTDMPLEFVESAMPDLLKREVFMLADSVLVMPNHLAAQEAIQSDKLRKAIQRERDRLAAVSASSHENGQSVTLRDQSSRIVTESHAPSQAVTPSHSESREVTPCCAVPSVPTHALLSQKESLALIPEAKKPKPAPPPFGPAAVFETLASQSAGRFIAGTPTDWNKGHLIAVRKAIQRYPDLAQWSRLGEWLAAGGKSWKGTLGVPWLASADLGDSMAQSAEWERLGRPSVDARGARVSKVAAAPVSDSFAPDDGPDPWAVVVAERAEQNRRDVAAAKKTGTQ